MDHGLDILNFWFLKLYSHYVRECPRSKEIFTKVFRSKLTHPSNLLWKEQIKYLDDKANGAKCKQLRNLEEVSEEYLILFLEHFSKFELNTEMKNCNNFLKLEYTH